MLYGCYIMGVCTAFILKGRNKMKTAYVTVHALTYDMQYLVQVFHQCKKDKGAFIDPDMRNKYTKQDLSELKKELGTYSEMTPAFYVVKNENWISGTALFLKPETAKDDLLRWMRRAGKDIPVIIASADEDSIELHFVKDGHILTSYRAGHQADIEIVKSCFFDEVDEINRMFGKSAEEQLAYLTDYLKLPLDLTMESAKSYPNKDRCRMDDIINVNSLEKLVEEWAMQIDMWKKMQSAMDEQSRANIDLWKNTRLYERVMNPSEEYEEIELPEITSGGVNEDEFVADYLQLVQFCLKQADHISPDEVKFQIEDEIIEPYVITDGDKEVIEFYDYIDFNYPEEDEMRLEVEDNMFYVDVERCIEKISKQYAKWCG